MWIMDEPQFSRPTEPSFGQAKKNRLESLDRQLYMKDESKVRKTHPGVLHKQEYDAPKEWTAKDETPFIDRTPHIKPSMFKKFFIVCLIFFVAASAFAAYKFFGGSNTVSSQNIDISIIGNSFTAGGEELPLQLEIKNNNAVALQFANLRLEYPKGSDDSNPDSVERKNISIGTIGAGKTITQDLSVTLFGEQGSTRTIKGTLEYRITGSNAIFTKEKDYTVNISSAPLTLTVKGPTETAANQPFTLDINTVLNAPTAAPHTLVRIEYPPGFQYKDANPKPILSNNVWELGALKQGVPNIISVQGSLIGQDGEQRSFRVSAGEQSPKDQATIAVTYSSYLHTLTIKKPFIEARLLVNGEDKDEYVSGPTTIRGEILWTNNLPNKVDNVEIYAKFGGSAFNESAITPASGFYDSGNNQIIWDKNTNPDLGSIEPGETGKVAFTLVPSVPASGTTSPQVVVDISIKGTQPALGNAISTVNNTNHRVIKITSDFQLAGQSRYYTGPFTNSGPIPPKAEQPTTYTITWSITNSANKIVNAQATTVLPSYVSWVGTVSPQSQNVTYDNGSRQITWKIGDVNAGTGLSGQSREVSFQVKLIPSLTQVGSVPLLIDKTTLTGQDIFTGQTITLVRPPLNTRLSNDSGFIPGNEKVVQ